ncbi:hypothetical protein D4764_20G0005000, partial [Takifugu flavidus]
IIAERLLEWFTSDGGVQEVHAVGLVLKASDNRLSDRLRYVFDSVASLFAANMEKNIFALLTHSDGGPPKNALTALADAEIKYAKDEQGQPVYFVFNNCQSDPRKSDQRKSEPGTGRYMRKLKNAWEDSEDEMKRFMEVLNVTEAQTLRTTVEVINQRNQLKECIINLQDKLKFIELKKKEIDQEKALHIKCEEKMKANKNYEEDVDEPYKDKVPIEGGRWWFFWVKGATSCLLCEETCHHKCACTFLNGRYCPIFDGRDHCRVCTNKCERKHHVKEKWIYVTKTRKQEMEKLLEQEHEGLEKSFQHITRLESIALKVDSIFTLKHLDFLIERMQDEKFAEEVRKLKEMKQRMEAQAWFKYKNITETSQLIQSGSPKIYQLNAVTKITEGLKTVTVGTKNVNRLNKTILLLDRRGDDEAVRESDVIMYQIFGFEGKTLPFSLTLVDTPGYGDNRDDTNDDSIAERLLDWFTSDGGVHEINAVGLVLKASDNRLSDRLGYVFDSVASLFGANMEENMFALLTHSVTEAETLRTTEDPHKGGDITHAGLFESLI